MLCWEKGKGTSMGGGGVEGALLGKGCMDINGV